MHFISVLLYLNMGLAMELRLMSKLWFNDGNLCQISAWERPFVIASACQLQRTTCKEKRENSQTTLLLLLIANFFGFVSHNKWYDHV